MYGHFRFPLPRGSELALDLERAGRRAGSRAVIEFTGERVIPGQVDADLWAEHFRAIASLHSLGLRFARVLDLGCGAGYGTAELAPRTLPRRSGIDLAPEASLTRVRYYEQPIYLRSRLPLRRCPFADASFDLVTAFEVIEHLTDWRTLLAEARRVLRPRVSSWFRRRTRYTTRNRGSARARIRSTRTNSSSMNSARACRGIFPHCTMLLQNHVEAFAFYDPQTPRTPLKDRMEAISRNPQRGALLSAVCSLRTRSPVSATSSSSPGAPISCANANSTSNACNDEFRTARAERDTMMRGLRTNRIDHMEEQNRDWAAIVGQRNWTKSSKQNAADLKTVRRKPGRRRKHGHRANPLGAAARRRTARRPAKPRTHHGASRWMKLGRKLDLGPASTIRGQQGQD